VGRLVRSGMAMDSRFSVLLPNGGVNTAGLQTKCEAAKSSRCQRAWQGSRKQAVVWVMFAAVQSSVQTQLPMHRTFNAAAAGQGF
jgi:hypothetical protein